ncbi:hypothetical protein D3C73_1465430 [compost metagenome]
MSRHRLPEEADGRRFLCAGDRGAVYRHSGEKYARARLPDDTGSGDPRTGVERDDCPLL